HVEWVDYKDVNTLRRLMSDRGKIKARRVTGTCRQHQRDVAIAIKTARELALLPYVLSPSNADKPGRGGRPRDGGGGGRRPYAGNGSDQAAGGEEGTDAVAVLDVIDDDVDDVVSITDIVDTPPAE